MEGLSQLQLGVPRVPLAEDMADKPFSEPNDDSGLGMSQQVYLHLFMLAVATVSKIGKSPNIRKRDC